MDDLKTTCPHCSARLSVPLNRIGRPATCPACDEDFVPSQQREPEPEWFVTVNEKRFGPFSFDQLKKMAVAGSLLRSNLLWQKGKADWIEACKVEGLFEGPPPPPTRQSGSKPTTSETQRRGNPLSVFQSPSRVNESTIANWGCGLCVILSLIICSGVLTNSERDNVNRNRNQNDRQHEQRDRVVVTRAEFLQVREGMTYSQVCDIIGSPGEELAREEIESLLGPGVSMYAWVNRDGTNMNATFEHGRLINKSQSGLD